MKEYTKVVDFKYFGVPYTMFIDNKDRYFFMKRDINDNYYYTTYEEQKMLLSVFYNVRNVMNIKSGEKIKISPKVIMGVLIASMTLSMFSGCAKNDTIKVASSDIRQETTYTQNNNYIDKFDFSFDDNYDSNFEIDTYDEVPGAGSRIKIHDSAYLDNVLGIHQASLEEFYSTIDQNPLIPSRLKQIFKDYCNNYVTIMPNADRRILYHNLKTLKVEEVDNVGLVLTTFSTDSCACYYPTENTITVLNNYEFKKGTWEYQVLFHEISHAARYSYFSQNGKKYEIKSGGYNYDSLILDETLNTLFSIKLLGYEDRDYAYQLQSNLMHAILESMDNYNLSDYINHSQSYFIMKLNEFLKEDRANAMIELMQVQYDEFHDENIEIDPNSYYPLFEFISDVYYKNRIVSGMDYNEAQAIKNELLDIILFDVPKEYNIDVNHIEEYFRQYCASKGIDVVNKSL